MKHVNISKPVGDGLSSDPADIKNIRTKLKKIGFEDNNPDYGYIDKTLDKNIRLFQATRNLKVDGVILPRGETENKINEVLAKSPTLWCSVCGAPHGGSKGDLCPDCQVKK